MTQRLAQEAGNLPLGEALSPQHSAVRVETTAESATL